jgi:hypothetical protein
MKGTFNGACTQESLATKILYIMKNILLILAAILLLDNNPVKSQEATLKPYGIKSGIIEYSYSGDKVGKGTLYFDNFGLKSAMYSDAVERGDKRKGWVVTSGDFQYMWDPERSTEGMKLKNPIIDWINSAAEEDIESFAESMYTKMGMEKSGSEKMLGKECKVFKGKSGKVLIWNGILMLLDMKMMGHGSHQEATSIEINVPVDAKYFVIPKNIKFSEMPMF